MEVIVTTTPTLPGYRVKEIKGIVFGSTVRTRGVLGRFVASIESITGGKASSYLSELDKARAEAIEELKRKASELGANCVLSCDLDISEVLEGYIMVTATGTAVVVERE